MAHILIAGLGAMGGLWATRLARRHQVSVLTRVTAGEQENGCVTLAVQFGDSPPETCDLPVFQPDRSPLPNLVMLACKTWQTQSLLPALDHPSLARTPILVMQNGMATQMQLATLKRPVLAATTTEAAFRESRRVIRHVAKGQTRLGALNPGGHGCQEMAQTVLADTGLHIETVEDIWPALWDKLSINCGINPYTALLDVANGEILGSDLYRTTIDGLCIELEQARELAGYPVHADTLRSMIEDVARATAGNTSSMRADIRAHRPTEIDAINGFVVDFLCQAGQDAPVNRILTQRIHRLTQEHG